MTVAPSNAQSRRRAPAVAAFVVILAALGVVALSLTMSRDHGSGVAAVQARDVPPFDRVELAGSNVITIRAGAPTSVVVHADTNLLEQITTRVEAGTLTIDQTGTFDTQRPMRVDVRVPSLTALTLSGSGVVTAAKIDAARLTVALPGSGVIRASGTVGRLEVALAGSGDVQLEQLTARDARATVRGSGRIFVAPSHSLEAAIPGTGTIVYRGDPAHVTTSVTGTGTVAGG
jgi:hypothetical protein